MLSFRDKITTRDPEVVRQISASTGIFDHDDVEITVELAKNAIKQKYKHTKSIDDLKFLFAEYDGQTVAYACFGKIADSASTYELYWLSTHNAHRGKGIGKQLINKLLEDVKKVGGSKLYIKTDSKEQYKPTRQFYDACGFKVEALLKEYYSSNDDCIIYAKHL